MRGRWFDGSWHFAPVRADGLMALLDRTFPNPPRPGPTAPPAPMTPDEARALALRSRWPSGAPFAGEEPGGAKADKSTPNGKAVTGRGT